MYGYDNVFVFEYVGFGWKAIIFKDSHSIDLDLYDHIEIQKKKRPSPPKMMNYHIPFNKKKHKKYLKARGEDS